MNPNLEKILDYKIETFPEKDKKLLAQVISRFDDGDIGNRLAKKLFIRMRRLDRNLKIERSLVSSLRKEIAYLKSELHQYRHLKTNVNKINKALGVFKDFLVLQ